MSKELGQFSSCPQMILWNKNSHLRTLKIDWRHIMNWVAQSYLTLCHPMACSPPGFSVHGIFQARILECVAISLSRGSSWPRDWTHVFWIADRFFTVWATREALKKSYWNSVKNSKSLYNLSSGLQPFPLTFYMLPKPWGNPWGLASLLPDEDDLICKGAWEKISLKGHCQK